MKKKILISSPPNTLSEEYTPMIVIRIKKEYEMLEISLTNHLIVHLMKAAREDFVLWNEALVLSKSLLSSFVGRSLEVMQIFGVN